MSLNNLEKTFCKAPVETVHHPVLTNAGITLLVKREDQMHPIVSGNKWRKLKYNIKRAMESDHGHLISMGGIWSNHLHALAFAGKQLGLKTTGLIRGEMPAQKTAMLEDVEHWGMQLKFINRSEFRELRHYHDHNALPAKIYQGYWIPEGGANQLALPGITEMIEEVTSPFDTLALACGTGTTLAGVISALPAAKKVIGFPALKAEKFLHTAVENLLENDQTGADWTINHDYHFGGFAKTNSELNKFIQVFEQSTAIPLEPVYTGKLFYGLFDLIKQGYFPPGHRLLVIHTGGLQGKRGFK